jgi:hypothetical protein
VIAQRLQFGGRDKFGLTGLGLLHVRQRLDTLPKLLYPSELLKWLVGWLIH